MNGAMAKASRRDIRRVLGASVEADLTHQQSATAHALDQLQAHAGRLDFHESQLTALDDRCDTQDARLDAFDAHLAHVQSMTFWQRMQWLVRGV